MKKATIFLLVFMMLIPNQAFADEKPKELEELIKEYEFISTETDYNYKSPNQITEDEKVFNLRDIEYEIISEKQLYTTVTEVITKEVIEEGLTEEDSLFAESIEVDEDGFVGVIPLKEIIYSENIETDRIGSHTATYDYGFQSSPPDPSKTLDVLVTDKRTGMDVLANLPLSDLKSGASSWENNMHALQIYRSIYEDEYLLTDGTRLSFLSDKPEFDGFADSILLVMRLSSDDYRIIGSAWIDDLSSSDGSYMRTAEYEVERLLTDYIAVYSGSFDLPDILTYTATAVYEGELTEAVYYVIKSQIQTIVRMNKVMGQINETAKVKREKFNFANEIRIKERQILQKMAQKKVLYEDWKDESINREEYLELKPAYNREISKLKLSIEVLKAEEQSLVNLESKEQIWMDIFTNHYDFKELSRDLLISLVDKILIHKDKSITIEFRYQDEFNSVAKQIQTTIGEPANGEDMECCSLY